ncbi:MAG: M56 family metallopeptidase [Bacteroidota bacterium]
MEAIVNTLIKAIGWSLFHSLWQGAIVYGILLLAINSIPNLKARSRHNMAYAALCLMFIGFVVTFSSIFKLPGQVAQNSLLVESVNSNYYDQLMSLPQQINSRTENMFPYLVAVYLIGLLIQAFLLGKGYLKLAKLKNETHTMVPSEWYVVFQNLIKELNLHQNIRFKLSKHVNVPLVIGYLKPVVLFPIALASQLEISQVEAILIHELSHIRRNDYLLNLIKTAIETLLFFNPFVWLSSRLINIEREHACDDLVIKLTGTPINYAHALLKLEILKDKSSPVLAMASTGRNQHLYQRIKRITDMKTNYMNAKQQIFAITLTIATIISLAWVSPEKAETTTTKISNLKTKTSSAVKTNDIWLATSVSVPVEPSMKRTKPADTTKKKHKIKIVTVDDAGNKKEYDSMKELPDSIRKEMATASNFRFDYKFDHLKGLDSLINFNIDYVRSPEFRLHVKALTDSTSKIFKKFNSEEFKAHRLAITGNAIELSKRINSPEFRAKQIELRKNGETLRLRLSGSDFKKQVEEIKELQSSPEYKKLKEKFEKDLEKLKEKKGIKTSSKTKSISIIAPDLTTADIF